MVADPLGHLAIVVRWERGEIGGLPHCHILISRLPKRSIKPSTCFAIKEHVEAQDRTHPYAPGDVSRYLSKGRFSSAADCEGTLRKFNRADWHYISPGAQAEMRRFWHRQSFRASYERLNSASNPTNPGWARRKAPGFRTGRENDRSLLESQMNLTQHLSILYDIYCLMLLKRVAGK